MKGYPTFLPWASTTSNIYTSRPCKLRLLSMQSWSRHCKVLRENDESITVEQVAPLVGAGTLRSTHHLYTVLSNLAGHAANDAAA